MILHVLTACSRPQNLERLSAALSDAERHGIALQWHVAFDTNRRYVGGQVIKNQLLEQIAGGWIWICDDDNLPHPDFLPHLPALIRQAEQAGQRAILVGQQRRPNRYLPAVPPRVGYVDAAMLIASRAAIGDHRIPDRYDGDGYWIVTVVNSCETLYVNRPLCYWNAQTWL
jgi:hypothetical protein